MDSPIAGDYSHIIWDTQEFNIGIVYHSGIITIDEAGLYRITTSIFANGDGDWKAKLNTYVNNKIYLTTVSTKAPGFSHGIIYLDVFDTVHFEKIGGPRLVDGTQQNYFTIEKIV